MSCWKGNVSRSIRSRECAMGGAVRGRKEVMRDGFMIMTKEFAMVRPHSLSIYSASRLMDLSEG